MDNLNQDSLDWALTHIERFGDTDIFPIPFEYSAIRHGWDQLRVELSQKDLSDYICGSLRRFLMPKPNGGFRVAIQLDPIDTIIYTAMVYEAATLIEDSRIEADSQVACSYRVELSPEGNLFKPKNGWDDFHSRSEELADSVQCNYVVLTDISDFYNQISHHRVRNALESANISSERAKNLENFLMELTGRQSRGLPVGPSASILLAEACLNDVDGHLLRKGFEYTRYVDDFRIFCETRRQAIEVVHHLSEYLNTSHRLSLASGKTAIIPVSEFKEKYLTDPEKQEEKNRTQRIADMLEELNYSRYDFGMYNTEIEPDDLEQDRQIIIDNLNELFQIAVSDDYVQLGLVRYILRRSASIRTNQLYSLIFDNLDKLSPVMRDVALYFEKTVQNRTRQAVGERILSFLQTSDYSTIPYVQLWLTDLLIKQFSELFEQEIASICEGVQHNLGKRPYALLAEKKSYIDWVRSYRETWQNNADWDRRAIIWSSSTLSADEQRSWLNRVKRTDNKLDKIVANAAQGMR